MMRKILNPLMRYEGYNCFGCSKKNPYGLKLDFYETDDALYGVWHPDTNLQGYFNVVHGGIQATLIDETGAWWIYVKGKTAGVTSRMNVRLGKTLHLTKEPIVVKATLESVRRQIYTVKGRIFGANKELCAVGIFDFFTFKEDIAKSDYYYPDHKDFIGEEVDPDAVGLSPFLSL